MNIHCFQHVPFETPAIILEWIECHDHAIRYTYFFEKSHTLPAVTEFDCLLVMGGPMNVDEEEKFPWLKEEKKIIKETIDANKKVMGICFGSQLIAAVLNKKIYKASEKEIGFFPVTFTHTALQHSLFNHFLKNYPVFHWHGDTFDLPEGAELIASTDVCPNEAFIIDNKVLALQFHLEMNEEVIEKMISHCADELAESGVHIQSAEEIRKGYHHLQLNKKDIFLLLDEFFK
jgi:GMP synthase (glutamine-hydrolysing)